MIKSTIFKEKFELKRDSNYRKIRVIGWLLPVKEVPVIDGFELKRNSNYR